jgi:all-trans-retinol dehydrogenase (NAD+)
VDLASASAISKVCTQIRADHGAPTVLISNAGIASGKTILSSTAESLQRTFALNNIAQFLLVKEFLPSMIAAKHGHVVTVASLNSFLPHAGNVDYACSKAAELAFHEGLTVELREGYKVRGVRTRYGCLYVIIRIGLMDFYLISLIIPQDLSHSNIIHTANDVLIVFIA